MIVKTYRESCYACGGLTDVAVDEMGNYVVYRPAPPVWGDTPPHEPGWYWWRNPAAGPLAEAVVEVITWGRELTVHFPASYCPVAKLVGHQWAGPFTRPVEAQQVEAALEQRP